MVERGSVDPLLRRDVLHFGAQRVGVYRAIAEGDLALVVDPGQRVLHPLVVVALGMILVGVRAAALVPGLGREHRRSEEHTSELQSLMRISYAVFCLKKKNTKMTT